MEASSTQTPTPPQPPLPVQIPQNQLKDLYPSTATLPNLNPKHPKPNDHIHLMDGPNLANFRLINYRLYLVLHTKVRLRSLGRLIRENQVGVGSLGRAKVVAGLMERGGTGVRVRAMFLGHLRRRV